MCRGPCYACNIDFTRTTCATVGGWCVVMSIHVARTRARTNGSYTMFQTDYAGRPALPLGLWLHLREYILSLDPGPVTQDFYEYMDWYRRTTSVTMCSQTCKTLTALVDVKVTEIWLIYAIRCMRYRRAYRRWMDAASAVPDAELDIELQRLANYKKQVQQCVNIDIQGGSSCLKFDASSGYDSD